MIHSQDWSWSTIKYLKVYFMVYLKEKKLPLILRLEWIFCTWKITYDIVNVQNNFSEKIISTHLKTTIEKMIRNSFPRIKFLVQPLKKPIIPKSKYIWDTVQMPIALYLKTDFGCPSNRNFWKYRTSKHVSNITKFPETHFYWNALETVFRRQKPNFTFEMFVFGSRTSQTLSAIPDDCLESDFRTALRRVLRVRRRH